MNAQESETKQKRLRDTNLLAFNLVKDATEPESEPVSKEEEGNNAHAVALGRLGSKKGGGIRAEKLTLEQRKVIVRKAAQERWKRK